jgi:hypothetical protein
VAITISAMAFLAAGEGRLLVALEQRREGFLLLPFRMLRRHGLHARQR